MTQAEDETVKAFKAELGMDLRRIFEGDSKDVRPEELPIEVKPTDPAEDKTEEKPKTSHPRKKS